MDANLIPAPSEMPNVPIPPSDPRAADEALRLIGSFVAHFSVYIQYLEFGVARCLGISDADRNRMIFSITGELTESQLRRQFFALTALVRSPSPEEEKIRTALNKRGQALAEKRNEIAHGHWFTSYNSGILVEDQLANPLSFEPTLLKTVSTMKGPDDRKIIQSREQLSELVVEAQTVADLIWAYQAGLFHDSGGRLPGVTDRLGFEDGCLVTLDLATWTVHPGIEQPPSPKPGSSS